MPESAPVEGWVLHHSGDLAVWSDPELPVLTVRGKVRQLMIIGPHFSVDPDPAAIPALGDLSYPAYLDARDDLSGRFCILACENGRMTLTRDAFGSRAAFYRPQHPGLVASHAGLLAEITGAGPDESMSELRGSAFYKGMRVKYLPGNRTMFEDVRGVPVNMTVDLGDSSLERYWPRESRIEVTDETAFDMRTEAYFKALQKFVSTKVSYVGLTAGVDTRFLTAGLLHAAAGKVFDLRGKIWHGPYSTPEERVVAERLAETGGVPVTHVPMVDISARISSRANLDSGGVRGGSRLAAALHAELPDAENALFLIGHGGEVIRGFYNLNRRPLHVADAGSFTNAYLRGNRQVDVEQEEMRPVVEQVFGEFIADTGIDKVVSQWGVDVNDIFYWEHRMANWSAIFLDEIAGWLDPIVGINDRKLFALGWSLPPARRLKKTLFKDKIDIWIPVWADEPLI